MDKINELLKSMGIFKDIKYQFNAGICRHCGEKTVTVINDKDFGICTPCHVAIQDDKARNKYQINYGR